MTAPSLIERLAMRDYIAGRVEPELNSGCWLWAQAGDPSGYGAAKWKGTQIGAHRLSAIASGMDVTGLYVCHRCDTPACCNPNHLFLGSNKENQMDASKKGRSAWKVRFGAQNPQSRLTERTVREIRSSNKTTAGLARHYGVSESAVHSARNWKTWRHVDV